MILSIQICENLRVIKLFYLVKNLIDIAKIVVPIILILMSTIDIIKNLVNSIDDKKNNSLIIKRFMYSLIIFFVPTFINFTFNSISNINETINICWNNSTKENIENLQVIENLKYEAQRKIFKEQLKKAEEQAEQERKEREEYQQQLREEAKREEFNNNNNSNSSDNNYSIPDDSVVSNADCKDPATDNRIYVKDGVFYIPASETSGTSGTQGSSPLGLNKCFYQRLSKFVSDAKSKGYTISINFGWRSWAKQKELHAFYGYNHNRAARPGYSRHGWGIAADLGYAPYNAALNWAHTNCKKYGLVYRVRGENWHIEPLSLVTY